MPTRAVALVDDEEIFAELSGIVSDPLTVSGVVVGLRGIAQTNSNGEIGWAPFDR
jgi:hypothetical protein